MAAALKREYTSRNRGKGKTLELVPKNIARTKALISSAKSMIAMAEKHARESPAKYKQDHLDVAKRYRALLSSYEDSLIDYQSEETKKKNKLAKLEKRPQKKVKVVPAR